MKGPRRGSTDRPIIVVPIFTALSAIGSLIKLGTPVGSIALDSSAGYFVAVFYGPWLGAIVGALGHIASAATGGFPLHYLHIPIAVMQAIWCGIFGLIVRYFDKTWAILPAGLIVVLLNGIVAPYVVTVIEPDLKNMLNTLIVMLLIASSVNVCVASVAAHLISKSQSRGI